MVTVRVRAWRTDSEKLDGEVDVSGPNLETALWRAVELGYKTGLDFHVVEAAGRPLQLYWNGLAGDPRWRAMSEDHRSSIVAAKALKLA